MKLAQNYIISKENERDTLHKSVGDITGRSDKVDSESQIACVNEIPALIWDVVPVE